MAAKSWMCEICGSKVHELGSYVKLALGRYAHWSCEEEALLNQGRAQGRAMILAEQAEAEQRAQVAQGARERAEFDGLGRCTRCGVKVSPATASNLSRFGEVRPLSSGTLGVCSQCVREEVQARAAARVTRGAVTPAQAIQQAPTAPVEPGAKPEPKKEAEHDRFQLIDLD